ncbi:MAG: DUF1501 domain-containing protein [Bacteroidetes bacterium]|nr:DUF1501 domain-containing protein [Bacteroidota bacterium]
MEKINRRKFIAQSALASGAFIMPQFVSALSNSLAQLPSHKKLVLIHLFGGNDGLNTIVPYENDLYFKARPKLGVKHQSLLKLNNSLGVNAAIEPFYRLYNDGDVCIINDVGYPNPEFSHFKSAQVWYKGCENKFIHTGWLGRYLDQLHKNEVHTHSVLLFNDFLNLTAVGDKISGIAMNNFVLNKVGVGDYSRNFVEQTQTDEQSSNYNDFIYNRARKGYQSFDYLKEHTKSKESSTNYPDNFFAKNLKTIAGFIRGNSITKAYYTSLTGFDTHANQTGPHNNLLKLFSSALYSFVQDLKRDNLFDDTCIMVFSEFGRSVTENAAGGTDHGTANSVYVLSGKHLMKRGFYNNYTQINDVGKYLEHQIDFRSIYATLLKKWLGANDMLILKKQYPLMDFI